MGRKRVLKSLEEEMPGNPRPCGIYILACKHVPRLVVVGIYLITKVATDTYVLCAFLGFVTTDLEQMNLIRRTTSHLSREGRDYACQAFTFAYCKYYTHEFLPVKNSDWTNFKYSYHLSTST